VNKLNRNEFDPDNIKKSDMNRLADVIEEYIDALQSVMIIPDELLDSAEDNIHESIKRTQKLIKKLRKGDKSVFKDPDEWNYVS
jgi:flagellar biosynthesis/type III secretory pathway chaperone